MPNIPSAGSFDAGLLGGGADIAGRQVEYWGENWGENWTITGRNYLGDWNVERFEMRPEGRIRITSSISPEILPEAHEHFARLISHS